MKSEINRQGKICRFAFDTKNKYIFFSKSYLCPSVAAELVYYINKPSTP